MKVSSNQPLAGFAGSQPLERGGGLSPVPAATPPDSESALIKGVLTQYASAACDQVGRMYAPENADRWQEFDWP